jgi:cell filamentation protein
VGVLIFDSQFDDRRGVLRNTKDLTDPVELEAFIARQSYMRVAELERSPLAGNFDIRHLRLIHKYIFQDVFPWAGDFREVTTSRTNSFSFPPPKFLIPSLENLFATLRDENHLKHLTPDAFAIRAAHYLSEINAVHPFREGNGRTQREFIRTLALTAGHRLVWTNLTQTENNEASRISYSTGNSSLLADLIRQRLL